MAAIASVGGFAKMAKGACDCDDPNCADNLDMDMLMDPCCAKDMKDSRRAAGLMSRLRDYDPARRALDERRGVIDAAPLFFAERAAAKLPEPSRGPPREAAAAADDDDDDDEDESEEEEEEDSDAEFLDDLENDSELMERMRSSKLREAEADLAASEVSAAQLRALVAARRAVVVHAFAPGCAAGARLDEALAAIGARRAGLLACRAAPAAVDDALLRAGRVSRDALTRSPRGALLAVVDGRLEAAALDIAQFADDDRCAADAVERWLDNAKVWAPEADHAHDDADGDDDADPEAHDAPRPCYYDCGKPGCQKAFEHHHVGLSTPDAWNVDKAGAN